MAKMGLKKLVWSAGEFGSYEASSKFTAKMVSLSVKINNAEGELYADDMLSEYVREFSSGDLTAEADNIDLVNQAKMYGATYTASSKEIAFNANDNAPYGGIGGYQVLMVNGEKKYRGWFFPKVRASVPDLEGNTKGSSISFGTEAIAMKVLAPDDGIWYYAAEFATEEAADAWIESKFAGGAV